MPTGARMRSLQTCACNLSLDLYIYIYIYIYICPTSACKRGEVMWHGITRQWHTTWQPHGDGIHDLVCADTHGQ